MISGFITRPPILHPYNPIAMLKDVAIAVMYKTNISLPFTMFITKHSPQKIPKAKFTGFLILTYASLHSLISNSGHHSGFPCSTASSTVGATRSSISGGAA
jgi:hypothetical protein